MTGTRSARIRGREMCHYCPEPSRTQDHIIPKFYGGTGDQWNLVGACEKCNFKKTFALPTCTCPKCTEALRRFIYDPERTEYALKRLWDKRNREVTFIAKLPLDTPKYKVVKKEHYIVLGQVSSQIEEIEAAVLACRFPFSTVAI
jgi:hypothetical protein